MVTAVASQATGHCLQEAQGTRTLWWSRSERSPLSPQVCLPGAELGVNRAPRDHLSHHRPLAVSLMAGVPGAPRCPLRESCPRPPVSGQPVS